MIKGISGWESCNLWQSVMIWLWLLSAGAKGNHLLQHVREIKGPADGFLTEREKCTDSSRSGWRCDDDAGGVCIIKRTGCDKTVAVHEGMADRVHVEGRHLVCECVCVSFLPHYFYMLFYCNHRCNREEMCVSPLDSLRELPRICFCALRKWQHVSIFPFFLAKCGVPHPLAAA